MPNVLTPPAPPDAAASEEASQEAALVHLADLASAARLLLDYVNVLHAGTFMSARGLGPVAPELFEVLQWRVLHVQDMSKYVTLDDVRVMCEDYSPDAE